MGVSSAMEARNELICARHNNGESFEQISADIGINPRRVAEICGEYKYKGGKLVKISKRSLAERDAEPEFDYRGMNEAFCAAMSAAIEAGLENPNLSPEEPPQEFRTIRYYSAPLASYCGSTAALCAEQGDRSAGAFF